MTEEIKFTEEKKDARRKVVLKKKIVLVAVHAVCGSISALGNTELVFVSGPCLPSLYSERYIRK